MSSEAIEQTESTSFVEGNKVKDKMANVTKVNGVSEESAGSASESSSKPKENGVDAHKHKSSSSSHGDGHSSHRSSSSSKHHSSSSDKHRSSSSKHREGGGSSSSSSKHKESSSSSSKHSSSSSSSKHKDGSSSSSSKHGSSSSSKHKDVSSSSSRDKEKSSSSSSSSRHKDASSSSSSKHKDGSSSKDKESSSSSKHRDGHSSSKDKTSASSSDKSRDKSKDSNSSSKDKHKSLYSSSSSRQDGDKHKSSSSSSKSKESEQKHSSSSSLKKREGEIKVKQEEEDTNSFAAIPETNGHVEIKKEEPSSPVKLKEEKLSSPVKVKNERLSPVKVERQSVSPVKKAAVKSEEESDDEDDVPLSARKKEARAPKRPKEESDYEEEEEHEEEDDEDADSDVPLSARANKAKKLKVDKKKPSPAKAKPPTPVKAEPKAKKMKREKQETSEEPPKKKKKGEEEQEVWKWWEEEREDDNIKWNFLEHKGPVFAPKYDPLPKSVKFYYEGKPMQLQPETEEVATFYGRMLDHDYTTRDVFNNNFMKDWRKVMSSEEKAKITDLKKCNFTEILDYFKKKSEEKKNLSKEEKQAIKKENEEIVKIYGFCTIDRHTEKIGNFKIEPPGLFRGRGDHPKQGMLKKRVNPEDVIINCSKDSKIPEPPAGHKWKEVRHDNTVTWLASWNENIQGATKYVMLNAASRLKGEKDWKKYETARALHKCVDKIRATYQEDWKSKEMFVRQRAVALYFIDKLALRAGNEKEEGETADTVGCCSLRVEHLKLHEEKGGKNYVVEFDFLGKDSIRYQNSIPVEKRVFKNLQLFMENKQPEDDLFDRLNTTKLNKHLQDLMEGLTAKVFRTYNASKTLSEQLELLTNADDAIAAKMLSYNRANRAVAILCNHQRAVPKSFEKSMENLQNKIDAKKQDIKKVKKEIKGIKAEYKQAKSVKTKSLYENKKKTLTRLEEQLNKLEVQATDKDENKEIALGTSKLNYLDPRISVAWCKKHEVPIEKVYNKTQRDKFRWAIDMATEHFKF
ncbi:hypothetical protein RRG08_014795 [Elysia crispata]|uniref:DNA topoisomerase I n=1 Tax=Elysia crispata TaxID=231223 RepID=A0AAE1E5X4_9GAST|nr:hypothetical protein RRG08_014795 [Elysia crispata]